MNTEKSMAIILNDHNNDVIDNSNNSIIIIVINKANMTLHHRVKGI